MTLFSRYFSFISFIIDKCLYKPSVQINLDKSVGEERKAFKINFIQYKVIVKFLSVVFAKAITMVSVGGFQNKIVRHAALKHFQTFPDGYFLIRRR